MSTYLLIQGGNMSTNTWNKLSGQNIHTEDGQMGSSYWDGTIKALESAGHQAYAPKLFDELEHDLTDHINQICDFIYKKDLFDIILVGHSYGGFVITGVADKLPERISKLVYLDSALPEPGQSLIDILDMVYSKDEYETAIPQPNPPYIEPIKYDPQKIKRINKVYILCTQSEFIAISNIFKEKISKSRNEWTNYEIESSHVPMADQPEELITLLLQIGL
jgi:pimeloyl-ACP methyl ester carboxylesterase